MTYAQLVYASLIISDMNSNISELAAHAGADNSMIYWLLQLVFASLITSDMKLQVVSPGKFSLMQSHALQISKVLF